MKEDIVRLEKEIHTLIREAERADAQDDRTYGKDKRGDELPAELARRESRLEKIKEAKRALEEQINKEKDQPPPDASTQPEAKIKTETDTLTGEQRPADKAQRNFTDPDSRIMPAPGKTFIQGYNPQVAVDSAHQIIIATYVTNCPNDPAAFRRTQDRFIYCRCTGSALPGFERETTARPDSQRPLTERTHASQAQNEKGQKDLRPTKNSSRAGVRPHQACIGISAVQSARPSQGDGRMVLSHGCSKSTEALLRLYEESEEKTCVGSR